MKNFSLSILLVFCSYSLFAQTVLGPGDLAFIGTNSDGATYDQDSFAFVLLKDIDAATQIKFTDRGWNDDTGFFEAAGDGQFTWTSATAKSAGDIIILFGDNLYPASYSIIGDQIFAYQGDDTNPIFIAGLHTNVTASSKDANWDGAATNNSSSALPDQLENGVNAIRFTTEYDNGQFSAVKAGGNDYSSLGDMRSTINNIVYWNFNDNASYNPIVEIDVAFSINTEAFITTWETTTANEVVKLNVYGDTYTVNWGDGNSQTFTTSTAYPEHTYASAGLHTVSITASELSLNAQYIGTTFTKKLNTVEQWGNIVWQNLEYGFAHCTNFKLSATDAPNLSEVTSLATLFYNATSFNSNINNWDVSKATSMFSMFFNATSFNQPLNNWDVSNVTDMMAMFYEATSFDQPLNNWDVSKATSMMSMFYKATSFDQPLNNWDVSNVTDMMTMFYNVSSFNQDLGDWNVSNVTNMMAMFYNVNSFNQDLGDWDISSVTSMIDMFSGVTLSTENYDSLLNGWSTLDEGETQIPVNISLNAGNSMYCVGEAARASLEATPYNWTITDGGLDPECPDPEAFITTWETTTANEVVKLNVYGDTYTVDWGDGTTESFTSFTEYPEHTYASAGTHTVSITASELSLNATSIGQFSAEKLKTVEQWGEIVWNSMAYGFYKCTNFTMPATDVPDLSNVTSFAYLFTNTRNFNQPLNNWDVSNVTDMSYMFNRATSFNLPLANWDVSRVTKMSGMFSGAESFNQPLDSWNVNNVLDMQLMFSGAESFNQPLNSWDVSNVTNMPFMFYSASSFDQPLDNWVVSSVMNMRGMFYDVTSFNQPLNSWDVSSVTYMYAMFYGASSFDQDLGDWDISSVTSMIDMFSGVTLSTENYDSLLNGWSTLDEGETQIPVDITFGAGNSMYCEGEAARAVLEATYNWSITDGGLDPNCPDPEALFITTWETTTTNEVVKLNVYGDTYTVDWGDGTTESFTSFTEYPEHTYATAGIHTVSITASELSLNAQKIGGAFIKKLKTVEQWGNIVWQNLEYGFIYSDFMILATDIPDLSKVTSLASLFTYANSFNSNINNWDVSGVTDMSQMFRGLSSYNQPLNNWDVSNVKNMQYMFTYASSFNQDLGDWDIRSVTVMTLMFARATSFDQDLGKWDISSVEYMVDMFSGVSLSTENYDSLLNGWSTLDPGETQIPVNISFSAGNSMYCEGITAREELITSYGWTITDGGDACPCVAPEKPLLSLSDNNICPGSSTTITINAALNDATGWVIYTDACGGTEVGRTSSGSFELIPPTGRTTYYIRGEDGDGCVDETTGVCSSITITAEDKMVSVAVAKDVIVELDATGNVSITPEMIDNGSSDACGIAKLSLDMTEFSCVNVGENTVTLTIEDQNGNTSETTAVVTVEDNRAPVALAQDISVQLDENGAATITPEMIDNGSSDACGIAKFRLDKTEFSCANVGDNTVTLIVEDEHGNTSETTSVVTVEDNIAPVTIAQNISVQLDENGAATVTPEMIDNGSSDACGIAKLSLDLTEFSCVNVGENTVTLTVEDQNGNTSETAAVVTVEDNRAPLAVAQDISVQLDENGVATITPEMIDNGSSDACGIAKFNLDKTEFSCANVGDNTVTLIVEDEHGNTSETTSVVTVEDNIAPVTIAQNISVQLDENGEATVTPEMIDNGSSDVCGIAKFSLNMTEFSCVNVGENTVTLTVEDQNGNTSETTAVVTVEDNKAPVALAQAISVQLDENGAATITPEMIDNGSSDACGIAKLSLNKTEFSCDNVGDNTVTLKVEDENGNSSEATAIVKVEDNIAPIPVMENLERITAECIISEEDVALPLAIDNCDDEIAVTHDVVFPITVQGSTIITWTFEDVNGNITTQTQEVLITDETAPVVNVVALEDIVVQCEITEIPAPTATDDCAGTISATTGDALSYNEQGVYLITWTYDDGNGNTTTQQQKVIVEDTTAPEVITQDITVFLDPVENVTITAADVDGGTTDNCSPVSLSIDRDYFEESGAYEVVLTATDEQGNSSQAVAMVKVEVDGVETDGVHVVPTTLIRSTVAKVIVPFRSKIMEVQVLESETSRYKIFKGNGLFEMEIDVAPFKGTLLVRIIDEKGRVFQKKLIAL